MHDHVAKSSNNKKKKEEKNSQSDVYSKRTRNNLSGRPTENHLFHKESRMYPHICPLTTSCL